MGVVVDEEKACWVVLSMATGIGPIRFQRLLEVCGGARQAWQASDLQLAAAGLERRTADALKRLRNRTTPVAMTERLAKLGIRALTLLDLDYPNHLRQIVDPPPVLFTRGDLQPVDDRGVALVGTRRATPYGQAVADRLARDLAAAGVTVISGLAKGVDTAAHRATVDAGGRTLAVLGNGLDQIYPPENGTLARQIVQQRAGALVSEFPPGVPPDAVNFPRRNRIISGLSQATVIIEAGERSGALITADFALEQGRDVLVVPGPILSPTSAGSNDLLKQGALPVTSADDILEAIGAVSQLAGSSAGQPPHLGREEALVWQALSAQPRHVDELSRGLDLGPGEVAATLTLLELKGLALQVGSMLYTRP